MSNKGWISLHRSIQDCWLWKKKPFSEGQAFIDMLLLANHKENKMLVDGKITTIERGQFVTSVLTLSERWGWDRRKTTKFLNVLEADKKIARNSTTHGTTVTIVNYTFYQDGSTTNDTTMCTTDVQPHVQPMHTNNNDNNVNNDNKNNNMPIVKEVLNYLNEKSGKRYTSNNQNSVRHIRARLNEGFTLDDFKLVIDTKVPQWQRSSEMKKYIRPETLFGTKFEGYLNEGGNNERSVSTNDGTLTEEQIEAVKRAGYGLW